jgi:hypothetical protein
MNIKEEKKHYSKDNISSQSDKVRLILSNREVIMMCFQIKICNIITKPNNMNYFILSQRIRNQKKERFRNYWNF